MISEVVGRRRRTAAIKKFRQLRQCQKQERTVALQDQSLGAARHLETQDPPVQPQTVQEVDGASSRSESSSWTPAGSGSADTQMMTMQFLQTFQEKSDQNFEKIHEKVSGINGEVPGIKLKLVCVAVGLENVHSEAKAHSTELFVLRERMNELQAGVVSLWRIHGRCRDTHGRRQNRG